MFEGLKFLLPVTLLTLIPFWVLPRRARSTVLLLGSAAYIGAVDLAYLAFFFVDVAVVFLLAGKIRSADSGKKGLLQLALVWLIGSLAFFKYVPRIGSLFPEGSIPPFVIDVVLPVGMSYITFRMIHYVIETYRGKIALSSFADFGAYVLFFPTYLAGPVERFPAFHKQTAARKDFDLADVNQGIYRIIGGVLKYVAGGMLAQKTPIFAVIASPTEYAPWIVMLAIYGLAIRVYLDFSGYTDIALGISRLFGYKVMENFNWPYLKKNIALFWRNWHISVYSFIRDYFFLPIFARRPSNLKTSIGIFCTMLVFMLWHEASWQFITVGAYHGTGLVVFAQFQELKGKSKRLRDFMKQKWLVPVSTFVTFTFVSFSFLVFYHDMPHIAGLFRHLLSL